MRFMMFMLPNISEEEWRQGPTEEAAKPMSKYNESLEKAGVLLDVNGLHSQGEGARVVFEQGKSHVVDGPFTEAKEAVGGYWLIQTKSRDEAIEWAKRVPAVHESFTIEVRQVFDAEDLPEEVQRYATPGS